MKIAAPHSIHMKTALSLLARWLLYLAFAVLICYGLASLGGCVMPGDLEAIASVQRSYEARVDRVLDDQAAGLKTQDEALDEIKAASKDLAEEVEDTAREVAERTKGVLSTAETGGVAGLATAAGMALLSMYRNKTRQTDPAVSNKLKA